MINLYKNLYIKSFFLDKFVISNVYKSPKIQSLDLKILSPTRIRFSKYSFINLVLYFYLLIGQKPKILLRICKIRNLKRKIIKGLMLNMKAPEIFLDNFVKSKLCLVSSLEPFSLKQNSSFNFVFVQTSQENVLSTILQLPVQTKVQITINSNTETCSQLRSFLQGLKIPCV